LSQLETKYDGDSNVIMTIDRERFDNETATGPLGNAPVASPRAPPYPAAWERLQGHPTLRQ
jgi:hypothetical protein